jgi:hypothetical protein
MASNHDWVVPAGLDERRFCVLDVGEKHRQDHPYFDAIVKQMNHGGREALLQFLLTFDLTGINLRQFPQTEALMETKMLSMTPPQKFWHERLEEGSMWPSTGTCEIEKESLHLQFIEHAKILYGCSRRATQTELGIALKKLCPSIQTVQGMASNRRVAKWVFPDLATCRQLFDQALKWEGHVWPEVEGDAPRTAPERKYSDPPRFNPPIANWSDYEAPVEPGRPPSGQGCVPQAINIQGENRPAEPA